MTTTKTLLAAAVAAGFALPASAAILDFETGYTANKTAIIGNEFATGFDVTFSSPNGLNIVKVGGPTDGFVPNDTPATAGALGSFFLTSDFSKVTDLSIDYDMAVSEASFDVADIDGLQDGADNEEIFTFNAFSGMTLLSTKTVRGGDAGAGDASVVRIGFSGIGDFDKITISGTTAGGSRNIGIAFDNFNTTIDTTTPVPLPAAAWMLMAGLGGLGFLGRKRRAA